MKNIIEHMGVQALVEYIPLDKVLFVHTISLKDQIYILAETGADAEAQFQAEVEKYLEECKSKNTDPFLPIYGHIPAMEIDPALHERLALSARFRNTTVDKLIVEAIEKYVK